MTCLRGQLGRVLAWHGHDGSSDDEGRSSTHRIATPNSSDCLQTTWVSSGFMRFGGPSGAVVKCAFHRKSTQIIIFVGGGDGEEQSKC